MTDPRRIHLLTLGCPKNRVDSEVMLGVLARDGHEIVVDPDQADVLVVNTCSFIQPAKEESIDAILDMARVKAARPGRRLVVTGCLAQRYADDLRAAAIERCQVRAARRESVASGAVYVEVAAEAQRAGCQFAALIV